MKAWMKWATAALVLALLAIGIGRALSARKAQQAALVQQRAQVTQTVLELGPQDLLVLRAVDLQRSLPVSGTLKAVRSAYVKARVAGELQDLTVREGDSVQAGQVIARIDATEYEARLRQAQLQADAAGAQVAIAQRQYDNNQALVRQGFISTTALDTSLANLEAARASHAAALAAADVARKSLADTVLRAPMAGQVAQRLVQPGERVAVEARLIELVDLSRLELEAALAAADAVHLRVGQAAQLQVEGLAAPVPARVVRINPSTQPGSRSVLAYLALEPLAGLRQGLFVQGSLDGGSLRTLAVPLEAVRTDKPVPYLQVVQGQQVRHVPVTPGARGTAGGRSLVAVSAITAGTLAEGSQVLAGTVGPVREGTAVRTPNAAN